MKKFINSIEKAVENGKKKKLNSSIYTIRRDIVKRALERGAYNKAICTGRYTDDYAWDAANNYGKGTVSGKTIADKISGGTSCWIKIKEDHYLIVVHIHSNLSYDITVPFKAEEKNSKQEATEHSNKVSDPAVNLPQTKEVVSNISINTVEEIEEPDLSLYSNVIDARERFAKRALA
ncbi:hypothetical protein U8V72_21260 [Priestia filamentosa]|uniref:hypothetical protein n=1 Tax=Priestia filamentosa TaxID=1402861 RepID=UPI00397C5CD7